MRFELGDKLYFWTIEPGRDHYLIGKVIDFNDGLYVMKAGESFFLVPEYAVIEEVDIHRTGEPIEWIDRFKFKGSKHEPTMVEVFTNGLCYVFAEWLSKRLYHSKIVYLKNEHHYVVSYQDKLYDITGDVTEQFQNEETDSHQFCGDWHRNR